jgi:SSS family solute:Na+ symporter
METLDWIIVAIFGVVLVVICITTNRMTKSVAGFLSSERVAGRYLLTIAQSMAFCSAIGTLGGFEAYYRNGIGGLWWGMLMTPVGVIIALSGWVIYRYRETRALTMAQFLEMRYSRKFRVFAGFVAFVSGMLNCAVFPMVTARFVIFFFGLPDHFDLFGMTLPTYHVAMFLLVGTGVTLAIAGGQVTIMVTDFFQGVIASAAILGIFYFVLTRFGWDMISDTLIASETVDVLANPDMVERLERKPGVSMLNPFRQGGLPDFGVPYFLMMAVLFLAKTGVWQGGAGYMTAARTPHEAKMGNILSGWRWLMISLGTVALVITVYTLVWNPAFVAEQLAIQERVGPIADKYIQSQVFVPVVIGIMLPAGLMGLFGVFMIGASISTDDSAYHSWGSIFLQDVIMPFRKKPFGKKEHLLYLRLSIIGIGAFAFLFSSIWTLKEFIFMWFEITGSIWFGGAACAIIGGLYWSRGTTQGAWAGLVTGSVFSVTGIVIRQIWPEMTFPWNDQIINGVHVAVVAVILSFSVYIIVSLVTSREKFDMDRLLHRGRYAVEKDHEVVEQPGSKRAWLSRKIGITPEFSFTDRIIYFVIIIWTTGWSLTFILGTAYNLANDVSSETWKAWWTVILGIQVGVAVITAIWYALGGLRDVIRLYRDLAGLEVDESDDGTVR